MTSQHGRQTIVIQILLNISRSKGNQKMKFDQLMEYDMKNISVEKLHTKYSRKINPDPFVKNQN